MSYVHFKFRSSIMVDSIQFTGSNISIQELKEEIVKAKKMDKYLDTFDLMIMNDQTKEVYKPDDFVPRNSSVVVARIPITKPKRDTQKRVASSPVKTSEGSSASDFLNKMTDVASMNLSEEDKLITVMDQGNKDFANVNYNKTSRLPTGPVPKNYICHRCGLPGHFIYNCPRSRDPNSNEPYPRLKRSTGIPNSFMTTVDDINTPGVLLTSSGRLAVPIIDAEAYRIGKKEKPPFVKSDSPKKEVKADIPKELTCPLCKDILNDAIVLPCCGNSACDNCSVTRILDSADRNCPICNEVSISPLNLIPNKFMRAAINNYRNETGYMAMSKKIDQSPVKLELIKAEPQSNSSLSANAILEPVVQEEAKSSHDALVCNPTLVVPIDTPQPVTFELSGSQMPVGEPVPIPGVKGAKMVRVLVARPGAPLVEQSAHAMPYNSVTAINAFSLPPPPLPHTYSHTIVGHPGIIQQGVPLTMNQARNSHILLYSSSIPPARVLGPPPPLVPMGARPHIPMAFPPRMPGTLPIAVPHPGIPPVPLTEEEFYREKDRLREMERSRKQTRGTVSPGSMCDEPKPSRKKDVFAFAEDIMNKKPVAMRRRTRSRTRSRSAQRSRSRSRSWRRSRSPYRRSPSFSPKSSPSSMRAARHASRNRRSMSRRSRNSRSPRRRSRSIRRSSSSSRKDNYHRENRESPKTRDSLSRVRDKGSRSPPRKICRRLRSHSNKAFRSSRSLSRRRSPNRRPSASKSPSYREWSKEKNSPLKHRSREGKAPKRKSSNYSRSPSPGPSKRQYKASPGSKVSHKLRYSPFYETGRRSPPQSPPPPPYTSSSRHPDVLRHPDRNETQWMDYFRYYKEWYDRYSGERPDLPPYRPKIDCSKSPSRRDKERAHHSRRSQSDSRRNTRIHRDDSRYVNDREKEVWRGGESVRTHTSRKDEKSEKSEIKESRVESLARESTKKKEKAKEEKSCDYESSSKKKDSDKSTKEDVKSESRRETNEKWKECDKIENDKRKDTEKKTHSSKEMPTKSEAKYSSAEKMTKPSKTTEIRSPPKSKVSMVSPVETKVHKVPTESSKETSVRIVTKDTSKTMRITVSSKWDSDKEVDKQEKQSLKMTDDRKDARQTKKEETPSDKESAADNEKSCKAKKKHKKDKKKHSKKHKSKA